MIERQTVGELRAALAALPETAPVTVVFDGRTVESDGIAVLGVCDGLAVLDADGDERPFS